MGEERFTVTRSDGHVLGGFDRMDEAQRAAVDDAAERNYGLKWKLFQGGAFGSPTTRGDGVWSYELKER